MEDLRSSLSPEYALQVEECISGIEAREDLSERQKQIYRLGHLIIASYGSFFADRNGDHQKLNRRLDEYLENHRLLSRNEMGNDSSAIDDAMIILGFYLDDNAGLISVPNDVINPNKSQGDVSIKEYKKVVDEAVERSRRDKDYKPLIFLNGFSNEPYTSKKKDEYDFGNAHVTTPNWTAAGSYFYNGIKKVKAEAVILRQNNHFDIDTQYLGIMGSPDSGNTLSYGSELTGNYNTTCREMLILHGGKLGGSLEEFSTGNIIQHDGQNNASKIVCREYEQFGGSNNANTVICSERFAAGKNSKVNCRFLYYGSYLNLEPEADVSQNVEIHDVPHQVEFVEQEEDIYVRIADALIKRFFPGETEDWSEIHDLFMTWFEEFKLTGVIPESFQEYYSNSGVISGKYDKQLYFARDNDKTYDRFLHIANIIAFYYLSRVGKIPNFNTKAIRFAKSYREIMGARGSVSKNEGLMMVMDFKNTFPEGYVNMRDSGFPYPKRIGFARTLDVGDGTVYKGGQEKYSVEMGRIKGIKAASVIFGCRPDIDIEKVVYFGDEETPKEFRGLRGNFIKYRYLQLGVECNSMGVMRGAATPRTDKIICNDSIVQYGDIKNVGLISAKKGDMLLLHIQCDGLNSAKEERCREYVQTGGVSQIGILECNQFVMNGGECNCTALNTSAFTLYSGHLKGPMKIRVSGVVDIAPGVIIDEDVEIIRVNAI